MKTTKKKYGKEKLVELTKDKIAIIYSRYRQAMFLKAYHILGNRSDAEEVIAEAFSKLLLKAETGEPFKVYNVQGYIMSIVINESKKLYLEKQKNYLLDSPLSYINIPARIDNSTYDELDDKKTLYHRAILNLSKTDKEILSYYMQSLKPADIAHKLNMSTRSVTVRIFNIKKRLKNYILKHSKEVI